jgi:hypothetical protein
VKKRLSVHPVRLSRRSVLRGLAAGAVTSIALPPLEAMMNATGTAHADGSPFPDRFGVWFWGNGIRRDEWYPRGNGADWEPGRTLEPLAPVKQHVSVVTGYEVQTATHPHHSGMAGILSCAPYHQVGTTRDTIVSTFDKPSVDQVAAAHFDGTTRFRSIEVGVARFRGTDEGTTFQHLSHNGRNDVNPSDYSPASVFRTLFGGTPDAIRDGARRSVLDAVTEQIRRVQSRVSAQDRRRLESHFESIRALEQEIALSTGACETPEAPLADYPDLEGREQLNEKNAAMSELMALALACDLTRAFSIMWCCAGSGVIVWEAGARNSLHQICHDEAIPQQTVRDATRVIMGNLSYFLQRLRDIPEGDGTLLDHCSILCTSELSEGNRHSNDEFPILIAGGGNGRLRSGIHHRGRNAPNATHAVITALKGAGLPIDTFGTDGGRATGGIAELLQG